MSKRLMKKVIQQRATKPQDEQEVDDEAYNQEQQSKKKNFFSAAMMRQDSDSPEEQEPQELVQKQEEHVPINVVNKKKKKNKKQKEKQEEDDEIKFLDCQIKLVSQEESKVQEVFKSGKTELHSCLEIIVSKLNYNKEIQKHFKNTKITGEDNRESKRSKGQLVHKNSKQHKLVYNPEINLKLIHKFQCEQVDLNDQGLKVYRFITSPSYEVVKKEYESVKASLNPQQMFDFLRYHPQYCEALYDCSEYFRLKGDYKQANELLETLLYIFEESMGYDFGKELFQETAIAKELEVNSYSYTFFMTLFKFTDILGKKGCYRSALEFSKLLLKVSPTNDPTGSLMLIDYNCLSTSSYDYLIYLTSNFGKEVYKNPKYSLAYMPNYIYNCALAKFLQARSESQSELEPNITDQDFQDAINNFQNEHPLKANYNVLLIQAILLYPSAILQLNVKNEYTKQHVSNCDSFVGWQRKTIKELFDLDFLLRETYLYWFLGLENDDDSDGLKKTIEVFVEKNKTQWKHAYVIQWVKGVIGNIQNQIEAGNLDLMQFYQKVSCLEENQKIINHIPFQFRRYKSLVKSHFSDQSERLDFNAIFAENIGAPQLPNPRYNPINQNQGMLGVLWNSLFPWVHNPTVGHPQGGQQQVQEFQEDFPEEQ